MAGFHLHYLDAGKLAGGHLLDFAAESVRIRIDCQSELHLSLQATAGFLTAQLGAGHDAGREIAQAGFPAPSAG